MLFQLLVSVASSSIEKLNTALMFIGIYLDRVGEEGLLSQERELKDMIRSTVFKRDMVKTFPLLGDERLIFPLNNINGSPNAISQASSIHCSSNSARPSIVFHFRHHGCCFTLFFVESMRQTLATALLNSASKLWNLVGSQLTLSYTSSSSCTKDLAPFSTIMK